MDPIVILKDEELEHFLSYMDSIREYSGRLFEIRVAIDEGGVKMSFDRGTWTRPMGEVQ